MIQPRIERREVATLIPAGYNPRTITEAAMRGLRASIERFGLVQPIVLNERTGRVVGGHQRLKVLEQLGETETDVVIVDLPETEEKALNLTLNNPAIAGDFTEGVLPMLDELQEYDAQLCIDTRLGEIAKFDLASLKTDFNPIEELTRLDQLASRDVVCPECGHEFKT